VSIAEGDAEPITSVRSIVGKSNTSFYYAMSVLPREQREAMHAVYAFCRAVDDIVDEPFDSASSLTQGRAAARERLQRWRREVAACYGEGAPADPIAQALAPVVQRYAIPRRYLDELINGMEMDLEQHRYRTFEELSVYCWRVASVVGLMAIRIFGFRHPQTEQFAERLGVALQLTNILRDLGSDAERGRIYLPSEDLERFGYREEELLQHRRTPAFEALMRFECDRAKAQFAQAATLFLSEEGRTLYPALIMGAIYRRILGRIEQAHYDVFAQRIAVPRCEQVALAMRVLWRSRWGRRERLAECLR